MHAKSKSTPADPAPPKSTRDTPPTLRELIDTGIIDKLMERVARAAAHSYYDDGPSSQVYHPDDLMETRDKAFIRQRDFLDKLKPILDHHPWHTTWPPDKHKAIQLYESDMPERLTMAKNNLNDSQYRWVFEYERGHKTYLKSRAVAHRATRDHEIMKALFSKAKKSLIDSPERQLATRMDLDLTTKRFLKPNINDRSK